MKKVITFGSVLIAAGFSPLLANNAQEFADHDPIGWMMSVIAMGVVFIALVILFLCFKYIYPAFAAVGLRIKKGIHRKKQFEQITDRRSAKQSMKIAEAETGKEVDNQEIAAAIGVALFLHEDGMHDQESGIITLTPSTSQWTGAGQNQKRSPLRRF